MTCRHCIACDSATHEARRNVRAWFRGYVTRYLAPVDIAPKKPKVRTERQYPTLGAKTDVKADW